jgi:tetratricopeptide (TPR) repeat protein
VIAVLALLLAAAPASAGPPDQRTAKARFDECAARSDSDPAAAAQIAQQWAASGGGVPAAQCLGVARSAAGDWAGAADAFTTAADLADHVRDRNAANLWVSAGNAALAGGDAARARTALGNALANPALSDPMKGEALLDRARADVAANDLPSARSDMNQALALVPADPMAWLLSATLARRMNDGDRASADIQEATLRAPNEPDILFEAGNIAAANGRMDEALKQWARAAAGDPRNPVTQAAQHELAANGGGSAPVTKPAAPQQGR